VLDVLSTPILIVENTTGMTDCKKVFLCWTYRDVFGIQSVKIAVVRGFLDYLFDWLLSKNDSAARIKLILSSRLRLGLPSGLYLSGPPPQPLCVSPVPHRCHMNGLISFQVTVYSRI
jgi:hypothetical protein